MLFQDCQNEEVESTFLHLSGPAFSFVFPQNPDILKIHKNQSLTKVSPWPMQIRIITLYTAVRRAWILAAHITRAFVCFKIHTKFSMVRNRLPGSHIEKMCSSVEEAVEYCKKDCDFLEFSNLL